MAVTYRIDPRERIVYLVVAGESSFEEWQAALRRVLADPAYVRGYDFLADRRGQGAVPGPEFPRQALRFLMTHLADLGRHRCAFVSPAGATFQMQRLFSILAEEADIHVEAFREYDEARRWLLGGSDARA